MCINTLQMRTMSQRSTTSAVHGEQVSFGDLQYGSPDLHAFTLDVWRVFGWGREVHGDKWQAEQVVRAIHPLVALSTEGEVLVEQYPQVPHSALHLQHNTILQMHVHARTTIAEWSDHALGGVQDQSGWLPPGSALLEAPWGHHLVQDHRHTPDSAAHCSCEVYVRMVSAGTLR